MEGGVARGDPYAWKNAKDGSGAIGCMGLPLDRSAAGFLCVSAVETLPNATMGIPGRVGMARRMARAGMVADYTRAENAERAAKWLG